MARRHVLILGGTTEARAIAAALAPVAGLRVTTSLAGRTERPARLQGEIRVGGFGGAEGLRRWLLDAGVEVLVDATHPFAVRISGNAREAAAQAMVALVSCERPAWVRQEGDRWIEADTMEDAAALLGDTPRHVFLAVGRQDLACFDRRRQHRYVVRSVDPIPETMLPGALRLLDRGPFDETVERDLLERHGIDAIVAKNSGGAATYGKIAAARALGIPVFMLRRPAPPPAGSVHSADDAVAAVHQALARLDERGA